MNKGVNKALKRRIMRSERRYRSVKIYTIHLKRRSERCKRRRYKM